jgi:hypothetical protein
MCSTDCRLPSALDGSWCARASCVSCAGASAGGSDVGGAVDGPSSVGTAADMSTKHAQLNQLQQQDGRFEYCAAGDGGGQAAAGPRGPLYDDPSKALPRGMETDPRPPKHDMTSTPRLYSPAAERPAAGTTHLASTCCVAPFCDRARLSCTRDAEFISDRALAKCRANVFVLLRPSPLHTACGMVCGTLHAMPLACWLPPGTAARTCYPAGHGSAGSGERCT